MRLQNVNTTDIRSAIELGCRCMTSVFNADDHDVPFFHSQLWPQAWLAWHCVHGESHVPGRHLNALLASRDALSRTHIALPLDESALDKHAAAAYFSYSGPLELPLNRRTIEGPLELFNDHNVREGFHALYALAAFRDDERAMDLVRRSLATIRRFWRPDTGWDDEALTRHGVERTYWQDHFVTGMARAIGPLVKLFQTTGCQEAMALATVLKDKAVAEHFAKPGLERGAYDRATHGDHTHSTTCVMSGLAQYATAVGDRALLEIVRAFYDKGLWAIRDEVGWVIENVARQALESDTGESNNTGDVLETTLLLAAAGWGEAYYDDAELILRAHLLPSQLRDVSWVREWPSPGGGDGRHRVADRHLGAFGFPAPFGHKPCGTGWVSFNMDIVGGAVGSLAAAWRHAVSSSPDGLRVNLLFDYESPDVRIESPYTQTTWGDGQPLGLLRVTVNRSDQVSVRIPAWADATLWRVRRGAGEPRPALTDARRDGAWLRFGPVPAGQVVEIAMPLTRRRLVLRHQTHDIHVDLRGDEVVAMENFGADLTFFDPL